VKDSEHLIRVAAVFLGGIVLFAIVRGFFVPATFGLYGHYRAAAVADVAALPVVHAGHEQCEACHGDVADLKKTGRHAGVNCEACHGPQGKHAGDPGSVKPPLPDPATLCVRCHEANPAKPHNFPQIVSQDHFTGVVCNTCHVPHNPRIGDAPPSTPSTEAKK
jgi:hypothetical protein